MKPSIKSTHRALFLALQADAKEFPGGISGVAKLIGVNGNTLANGINPDHPTAPPPFATIVEIITLTQARRTVCLPHARGGVSNIEHQSREYVTSSPRPWGCFLGVHTSKACLLVLLP